MNEHIFVGNIRRMILEVKLSHYMHAAVVSLSMDHGHIAHCILSYFGLFGGRCNSFHQLILASMMLWLSTLGHHMHIFPISSIHLEIYWRRLIVMYLNITAFNPTLNSRFSIHFSIKIIKQLGIDCFPAFFLQLKLE